MHEERKGADEDRATTAGRDGRDRAEVLREVLDICPAAMTLDELVRELTVASDEFAEQDRVRRAVRDLTAGGLLQRVGGLVLPTRAAVNFNAVLL